MASSVPRALSSLRLSQAPESAQAASGSHMPHEVWPFPLLRGPWENTGSRIPEVSRYTHTSGTADGPPLKCTQIRSLVSSGSLVDPTPYLLAAPAPVFWCFFLWGGYRMSRGWLKQCDKWAWFLLGTSPNRIAAAVQ